MLKKLLVIIGIVNFTGITVVNASCYNLKSNQQEYVSCRASISAIFTQGYNAFNNSNYIDAITYYKNYLIENGDSSDADYMSARYNIGLAYKKLGIASFYKDEFRTAVDYFLNAIQYGESSFELQYNLASSYYNLGEYPNAGLHATNAYNLATEKKEIEDSKTLLTKIESKINLGNAIASAPTNDTLGAFQYYISALNIPNAWKEISNPKQVIVAIIDDGININHPDLTKNIWIAPNNTYGNSKIISFQNDGLPDNATAGEHGTMVAGIIGATTGNNEGIAGIAKNVKLMPLRVFDQKGNTKTRYIIDAMNYAIDNGANIINLSLGRSQFSYIRDYDEVIKKAYDKGILVVISGGNGDVLANEQNGVNLDINPISPVCNNNGKNYSFGVFATDKNGFRTLWTNYGKCTPFFAPGEEIVSTSVALYNDELGINYNQMNGTSFSAPIVSGVLALGYNKYGKVTYPIVYDALTRATTNNAKGNPVLDANKYLNNLQSYFDNINAKKLGGLKNKAQLKFDKYKRQYSQYSQAIQKLKYQSLLEGFKIKAKTLKGDNLIVNNLIIELINAEVSKL